MIVAIASGKGGTGKTTVAVNLARVAEVAVQLVDCDVEAPNARIFLPADCADSTPARVPVPLVDPALCDACGECARFCEFNALACVAGRVLVFSELCHGCGGCMRVCPRGAISESTREIGAVVMCVSGEITLVEGRMNIGVAMAPPLIRAVKRHQAGGHVLIDAPPGTSCPMISAVRGSDYVLLVTEPTAFGLNDFRLAVETVRVLGLPFGAIINRCGSGDGRVERYCAEEGIPILLRIPGDRRYAEAYSRGELLVEAFPELRRSFSGLWETLLGLVPDRALACGGGEAVS